MTGLTTVVRIAVENDRYRAVDDLPLRIPEGGVRTHQVYDSGILTSFEKTIKMLSSLDITLSCQGLLDDVVSVFESSPFSRTSSAGKQFTGNVLNPKTSLGFRG